MNSNYLLLISLCCFLSCSQKAEKIANTFIVPSSDTITVYNTSFAQSLPPRFALYYLPSNFIIDTGGHIYYYQEAIEHGWVCGNGLQEDRPPSFIDLKPVNIIEVSDQNLVQFIKLNIQDLNDSDKLFSIASTADTITSTGLATILPIFKDTTNHITWTFRRTTLEENTVLDYKKKNKAYNADKIKWDSTKISFAPSLYNIKFTPPKISY